MGNVSVSGERRKRIWVQQVAVSVNVLETRLAVAEAQELGPEQRAAAEGIREFLTRARSAAFREDPIPGRWANWWRGTLVDAAYQNLHAARAQIIDLYGEAELAGEAPSVVSRAHSTIHRDNPSYIRSVEQLTTLPIAHQRALMRRTIEDSYEALDRKHERLRSFRNIVAMLAVLIALFVALTVAVVVIEPSIMPLCFSDTQPNEANGGSGTLDCPTGSNVSAPASGDIVIVALLGMLGGALAAAVSIRNLSGTSTLYDVPVALAMLKIPMGAFTAILGLLAIRGDFVPGLSALDSQDQILAYALLLGFGQQIFTQLLDKKAQTLLDVLPAKGGSTPPPGGDPFSPLPLPPDMKPPDDSSSTLPDLARTESTTDASTDEPKNKKNEGY